MPSIPTSTMTIAALVLGALAVALPAGAADRDTTIAAIEATGPLTCLHETATWYNRELTEEGVLGTMRGIAAGGRLDSRWKPGLPDYDTTAGLVRDAVVNTAGMAWDEQVGVERTLQEMDEAELRELAAYVAQKDGKIFWHQVVDNLTCASIWTALGNSAIEPGVKAEAARRYILTSAAQQELESSAQLLPEAQQAHMADMMKRYGPRLVKGIIGKSIVDPQYKEAFRAQLGVHRERIQQLTAPYVSK